MFLKVIWHDFQMLTICVDFAKCPWHLHQVIFLKSLKQSLEAWQVSCVIDKVKSLNGNVRLERNAQRNEQRWSSKRRNWQDNLLPKAIQGQQYNQPDISFELSNNTDHHDRLMMLVPNHWQFWRPTYMTNTCENGSNSNTRCNIFFLFTSVFTKREAVWM